MISPLFPASAIFAAALMLLLPLAAGAQEIYKWTDASGKVHYGDRAAAPDASQKIHVAASPPVPAVPATKERVTPRVRPQFAAAAPRKSIPADQSRVGPECKGLIDQIAAVPAGKNWEALYGQFVKACPGLAYECVEYKSQPEKNQCIWAKRQDSNVLFVSKYP